MVSVKVTLFAILLLVGCISLVMAGHGHGHAYSYTSVHNKRAGKYEYKIDHSKHGHFSGHAHPHGYGGFGEKH